MRPTYAFPGKKVWLVLKNLSRVALELAILHRAEKPFPCTSFGWEAPRVLLEELAEVVSTELAHCEAEVKEQEPRAPACKVS